MLTFEPSHDAKHCKDAVEKDMHVPCIRKITKVWQVVIAWRSVAGVMDLAPHQATLPFFDLWINSATHVTINRSRHRTVVVCVSIDHATC